MSISAKPVRTHLKHLKDLFCRYNVCAQWLHWHMNTAHPTYNTSTDEQTKANKRNSVSKRSRISCRLTIIWNNTHVFWAICETSIQRNYQCVNTHAIPYGRLVSTQLSLLYWLHFVCVHKTCREVIPHWRIFSNESGVAQYMDERVHISGQ